MSSESAAVTSPSPDSSALIRMALPPGAGAAELRPILDQLHGDAVRNGVRQVTLDVRGAGPLGIAGLQHFVGWLLEIQDLPRSERYSVHFIGDEADHWQKRGLQALRACADNIITISFVEGHA
jgi:hypothetical protein